MRESVQVCVVEDLPLGKARAFVVGEEKIAVFHQPNGFFAIGDTCPHRGASLAEGFVCADRVACPWHQWEFGLRDGFCANIPGAAVTAYAVTVRDGAVWVEM